MKNRILQFLADLLLIANLKRDRLAILFAYLKFSFKKPLRGLLRLERESFLGFTVYCPDYHQLFVMFREIFVEQAYYVELHKSDPFIVDCGGNIGMATLYFKYLYPEARIVVYEPSPAFAFLAKNIRSNRLDVVAKQRAVFDKRGTVDLHFNAKAAGFTGATTSSEVGASKRLDASRSVLAARLSDEVSGKVDVLKLDIEGSEGRVLADLARHKKLTPDHIVMEFHHNPANVGNSLVELLGLLRQNGYWYRIWGDRPGRFDLNPSHVNIHAILPSE
jgi:FkbM family methyltransferase